MRIQTLLEAVIKVPKQTYDDAMGIVLGDVLSRIRHYLRDNDDSGEFVHEKIYYAKEAKRLKAKYPTFHELDLSDTEMTYQKIYMRMPEVDQRYFYKKQNVKDKTYALIVNVVLSDNDVNPSAEYHKKAVRTPAKIVINLPSAKNMHLIAKNPDMYEALVDKLEGAVRHELIHAVQDMALGEVPDVMPYYNRKGELKNREYYQHELEYQPQMVSTANDFVAYYKELKGMGYEFSTEDLKQLFRSYVDPKQRPPRGIQNYKSEFLKHVYKLGQDKWRKAVKVIYGLVREKLTEL